MSRSENNTLDKANVLSRSQAGVGIHIAPAEWRWLIFVTSLLVLLAFVPLIWIAVQGTGEYAFMGALHNYLDGATYLSKMQLGANGSLLVKFQHTPEPHNGAFIQIIYPLLGYIANLFGIPNIVMLHVARLGASLFMYVAIYQLGASIYTKVRPRRLFFALAAAGAGFGWVLAAPMNTTSFPDLTIPEIFPFYSSLMNVHFPLTFALVALLVSILIVALRPGAEHVPSLDRQMPSASLISLALALLYPQVLVPLGGALFVYALIAIVQARRWQPRLARWVLAVGLPAAPLVAYYWLAVESNPALAVWNAQNVTSAPPIHILALGLGLPLLIAIPGIARALRRFEMDGDRLFLLWLIVMVVAMYLPTNIQRRFSATMMLPIAYFATRALEDVWLRFISRRRRALVFAALFAVMPISLLFTLFAPVLLFNFNPEQAGGVLLPADYAKAFDWLDAHTNRDTVILASPQAGTWIPAHTNGRVVYGHPYETLEAETKLAQVNAWYAETDPTACRTLLDTYDIRYVIVGPLEQAIGPAACTDEFEQVAQFGSVTIYAP